MVTGGVLLKNKDGEESRSNLLSFFTFILSYKCMEHFLFLPVALQCKNSKFDFDFQFHFVPDADIVWKFE